MPHARTPSPRSLSGILALPLIAALLALGTAGGCAARDAGQASSRGKTSKVGDGADTITRAGNPAPSKLPTPGPDREGHPTAPISPTDACADRLHDLAGPLLYHFAMHRRLPETLDQLEDVDGAGGPIPPERLRCPVSGKPYVYNPTGLAAEGKPGLMVIYDPEPSHSGMRWAISAEPSRSASQPLITHLIAVPEAQFHP